MHVFAVMPDDKPDFRELIVTGAHSMLAAAAAHRVPRLGNTRYGEHYYDPGAMIAHRVDIEPVIGEDETWKVTARYQRAEYLGTNHFAGVTG